MLVGGAEFVVRGSVSFGKKLKVSLFAIGVVVVAGGTSLPELASSIKAVLANHSDLAVGAVIGSNIANLILIMATTSFLTPIDNINQNQINQAWINIALSLVLICISYFFLPFNFIFGFISSALANVENKAKINNIKIFLSSIFYLTPLLFGMLFYRLYILKSFFGNNLDDIVQPYKTSQISIIM